MIVVVDLAGVEGKPEAYSLVRGVCLVVFGQRVSECIRQVVYEPSFGDFRRSKNKDAISSVLVVARKPLNAGHVERKFHRSIHAVPNPHLIGVVPAVVAKSFYIDSDDRAMRCRQGNLL